MRTCVSGLNGTTSIIASGLTLDSLYPLPSSVTVDVGPRDQSDDGRRQCASQYLLAAHTGQLRAPADLAGARMRVRAAELRPHHGSRHHARGWLVARSARSRRSDRPPRHRDRESGNGSVDIPARFAGRRTRGSRRCTRRRSVCVPQKTSSSRFRTRRRSPSQHILLIVMTRGWSPLQHHAYTEGALHLGAPQLTALAKSIMAVRSGARSPDGSGRSGVTPHGSTTRHQSGRSSQPSKRNTGPVYAVRLHLLT